MISKIEIENFRSIKKQSLPIAKLNIVYGQNGSGKSSAMYAPYVFRNFYVNPNQRLNSLFNLGFMNLGGFENVVRSENSKNANCIIIKIEFDLNFSKLGKVENKKLLLDFSLSQNDNFKNLIYLEINSEIIGFINFGLPYNLDETISFLNESSNEIVWDGITYNGFTNKKNSTLEYEVSIYNDTFNQIKNFEIISVKRGFFNALFNSKQYDDETKLALKIREEGLDFESKIDHYFKQIFDKTFRYVAIPGSDSFYLRTQSKAGLTTDLVNEGFGVNQTIYMLIKLLKKDTSLAFIEEPEIHLHPSAQSKLVDVFNDIVQKEDKQIFITTHSENIVSTVLARIAEGKIKKEDVNFFLCKNEGGETIYELQKVNDNGQISGGLMPFMETELSNLKAMLGV